MAIVVALLTDSEEEAFRELCRLQMKNDGLPWDMSETYCLLDAPKTTRRWCVFRKL